MTYTTKEKKTIRDAFTTLEYLADVYANGSHYLKEALKHEKKERQCITLARALIIQEFRRYILQPDLINVYDISHTAPYITMGAMAAYKGFRSCDRHDNILCQRAMKEASEATEAYEAEIERCREEWKQRTTN